MRLFLAGILVGAAINGQTLMDPTKTALFEKYLAPQPGDKPLRCEVNPFPPRLSFSLRFQTGYVFRVPLKQYFGPGHEWGILTKVTPDAGGSPVYLGTTFRLPNIPKTKVVAEWGGTYMVGEGRYRVDWILYDNSNRICRKSWHIEAKLNTAERGLGVGMPSNAIAPVSFRRWAPKESAAPDVPTLRRLTVLLHAAPLSPGSIRFRVQDRIMLLGSLASLLESIPARSVRLVVFNLDQQKELFRQDTFTPDTFDQVSQSMSGMELRLVDYRVLEKRLGHVDLLADLVNQELRAQNPSDAVVFLGPATRYSDKVPQAALEEHSSAPPFFYLQYRPYLRLPAVMNYDIAGGNANPRLRRSADFPDSIEFALKRLHGKTLTIYTADDFAKAIKQVEAQLAASR